jgi:hypothetical protein
MQGVNGDREGIHAWLVDSSHFSVGIKQQSEIGAVPLEPQIHFSKQPRRNNTFPFVGRSLTFVCSFGPSSDRARHGFAWLSHGEVSSYPLAGVAHRRTKRLIHRAHYGNPLPACSEVLAFRCQVPWCLSSPLGDASDAIRCGHVLYR